MTPQELSALHLDIWARQSLKASGKPLGRFWREVSRTMTPAEIEDVFATIRELDLMCEVFNSGMGFGISLVVYDNPGYPMIPPRAIFEMCNKHISKTAGFDEGWDLFFPVVSREQNARLLEFFGRPPLRGKHHYDY